MNQILEYGAENNKKSSNKNGGSSSDKIIKVFAFLMLIVAIAFIASGIISLTGNKKTSNEQEAAKKAAENNVVQATITAEADEETKKVKITVESEYAIDRVTYSWNQSTSKVISGEKSTSFESEIDLPAGDNTLNIIVLDVENNTTTDSFDFSSENGVDNVKPEIKLEKENGKLYIIATDDTALAYITYMWNDGDTVTVNANEEDPTKIEVELEIPEGENVINVVAVDASEVTNTKSINEKIIAKNNPEITYETTADLSKIIFTCSHDKGISSVYYVFNGQEYGITYEDDEAPTSLQFEQASDIGENTISLTVKSTDDTEKTFEGTWSYGSVSTTTEQ
jgi:hypothetical protein